jgi:hypothetical protein
MENQFTKQAYELMQKKLAELKARRVKISVDAPCGIIKYAILEIK